MREIKFSDNLTIYYNNNYPKYIHKISHKKYTVILGVGGNIGDTFRIFDCLLRLFENDTKIQLLETSPILKNPPFGYLEQDAFYNAVIKISTNMTPLYLLNIMQKYEKRFGRKRSFKDAPRTLDIDIIFIKNNGRNILINNTKLIIPHIDWKYRKSVIIPLQYIGSSKLNLKYKYKWSKYDK